MQLDYIFACVLVLLAGTCVGLALLIFDQRRSARTLDGQVSRHERLFVKLSIDIGELKKMAPVKLAAEVAGLEEAVARLRATHQRFQGRFDQYMGQQRETSDDGVDDPKWHALMALQNQGKGNGGP